jgi:hypothetical protein
MRFQLLSMLGLPEASALVNSVVAGVIWVVANVVYFTRKLHGRRGFARLLAFWFGLPLTWATFFLMPEGRVDRIRPPPDDEGALFDEVRRDRALRAARAGPSEVEGEGGAGGEISAQD